MEAAVPPPIHSDKKFPDVIELNVGGKCLTTTLGTLRKEPDSMLASMFSGRHKVKKDENNRYFIDCDAKMFGYVLNYLRSGSLPPGEVATGVYDMAMYFGIQSLVERLKNFHSVQYRKKINNLKQEIQAEEYEQLKEDAIQGIDMYTVSPAEYKTFHVTDRSCESPDCVHNEKSTFKGREPPSKQNILVVTGYTATENMFSDIVELNVGGELMATTLSTLQKEPNSWLTAMILGQNTGYTDKKGRYFIDSDCKIFRHILQYLRFEVLPPIFTSQEVYKLAKQFNIRSLVDQLENVHAVRYQTVTENAKREIDIERYEKFKMQIVEKVTELICSHDGISLHIEVNKCTEKAHAQECVKRHRNASDRNGRTYGIVLKTDLDVTEIINSCLAHDLCELGYGKYVDTTRQCQHKCNCFGSGFTVTCHRIELSHVEENQVHHDIPANEGIRHFSQKLRQQSVQQNNAFH
ncbi:uncharacterized protein LOC132754513 isoform X2 [Ruditapes philippinarum]|uniref:uncharacterized protein LOC132754513 isoform X2 n=1 Tax=Ruditapes philippinarum TaxID=129788 RepID=UPI00295AA8C8|nr:uncharacterized protein LOC132754513 isoform X2 [Ruditapes philippinarum]